MIKPNNRPGGRGKTGKPPFRRKNHTTAFQAEKPYNRPSGDGNAPPIWTRPAGVRVQRVHRVLRFDAPNARGLWWAPFNSLKAPVWIKLYNRPGGRGKICKPPFRRKNHTTAPLARGNAPLLPPAAASPPEGEIFFSASLSANLSRSVYSGARTSPSGGSTAVGGDRGAFPTGEARFACFLRPKGGCLVFISRSEI